MTETFVAMYDSMEHARMAIEELVQAGFPRENISLVANDADQTYTPRFAGEGGISDVDGSEGAGVGAIAGALIGLGSALIPGVGPVVAAGTLGAALIGAGVGAAAGAVTGGLTASLVDFGIPEEDAQLYAEGIRRGGAMVTVMAEDQQSQQVRSILNRHHPANMDTRGDYYRQSGWAGYDAKAQPYTAQQINQERDKYRTLETGDEARFDIVQEELQVGKREVERGRVRAHAYVVETPVQEQVNLREERVTVQRRPVDRPATSGELNAFQEGTIEVTEHVEQPVVQKSARVVEEVIIGKETTQRTETVEDTVRRTDVDIDSDLEDTDVNPRR